MAFSSHPGQAGYMTSASAASTSDPSRSNIRAFYANSSAGYGDFSNNNMSHPNWGQHSDSEIARNNSAYQNDFSHHCQRIVQAQGSPGLIQMQSFRSPSVVSAGGSDYSHQLPLVGRTQGLNHDALANVGPSQHESLHNSSLHNSFQHFGRPDLHVPSNYFAPMIQGLVYGGEGGGSFGPAESMKSVHVYAPRPLAPRKSLRHYPYRLARPPKPSPPSPLAGISPLASSSSSLQNIPQPVAIHGELNQDNPVRPWDRLGLAQYAIYPCKWISEDGVPCGMYVASDRNSILRHHEARHGVNHVEEILCRWDGLCPNNSRKMLPASIPRHLETHFGIKWGCSSCDFIATRHYTVEEHTAKNTDCSEAIVKEVHGSGVLFVDVSTRAKGQ
ncbi:hypothetical protein BJ138DRAFT_1148388 [Hygrophoropsis aurantiaca]|uniref:Uncharacterized protein n=1 Tax=Hygrophoropsis aurantiaca TaxID=72124 RepID=A0ACB8AHH4_9AGAM|nr:hypothetical protein BJ138DRAFT_1148388 [Hygrophoropsis aurantiaca]